MSILLFECLSMLIHVLVQRPVSMALLPAQQMLTISVQFSVFGIPPPRSSDPGGNSARLRFWLPPAQLPSSYEAVVGINDARMFLFASTPAKHCYDIGVCARVCASVDELVLPTLVRESLNIPINSNRLLGLVGSSSRRVREVPGSILGAAP